MIVLLFVSLVLVLVPSSAFSQVTKGSISGTVTDSAGAAISNVNVKAIALSTGNVFEAVSDKVGDFRFNLIPPGEYRIEIKKQNFASKTIASVAVSTGVDASLGSIALNVASASQTVQVIDSYTPLIETTQAQISNNFDSQQLSLISGINENEGLDNLALLVPGVNNSRENNFGNYNGATFQVDGLRGRGTDQQIDGQNNNDNSVTGPAIFLSNSEFASEYQIVTNNFGPEYGRNSSAVVNILTKSGTNKFHGGVYGSENSSILNTLTNTQKQFSGLTKVPSANQQFAGFTVGGPIKKDKLFFFAGFDEQFYHTGETYTSSTYTPTAAGLTQLASISGVDANAISALKTYSPWAITIGNPFAYSTANKTVTINNNAVTVPFATVQRSVPTNSSDHDVIGKIDYQTGKDTITGRFILQRQKAANEASNGAGGWFYDTPSQNQAIKAGWTRSFSKNVVNELAVAFGRNNVEFGGGANGTIPDSGNLKSAVAYVSISRVAGTSGSSGLGFGGSTTLPQNRIINTWQIQDNLIYDVHSHHLKAGINWTYQRSLNTFLPYANGSYSFTNFSTFLSNTPSSVTIANGNANLDFREYDTFLYVSDDWKITKNLTFTYGLTWSSFGQPANLFNSNDTKLQNSSSALWNSAYAQYAVFPKLSSDYTDFAPNVGFAWSPDFLSHNGHQTVIRGGYRLAYDPPFYNIYLNIASSSPQVFLQTIASAQGTLPSNPTGANVRSALASYLKLGVSDPRSYSTTNLANNFRSDRVQSWSLGIQRELNKEAVVEARYVGNSGDRLFQSINGSPYLAGVQALFPNYDNVTLQSNGRTTAYSSKRTRTNTGYSAYHALQTELRADHLFNQLLLRTGFTWSKTTDNTSEIYSTGGGGNTISFAQDPLNYKGTEHGLSGLDTPFNWTFSFAESIPFQKEQHGLVGKALGGWGVAGTYFIASGQPYTPYQYYFNYMTTYYGGATAQVVDKSFNTSFIGTYDGGLRPFLGNKKASAKAVGVYAGDADIYFGTTGASSNTLLSFNDLESSGTVTPVSKNQVRYIANGPTADTIYNTPYGDAGRNLSRDYWTNTANATISKNFKFHDSWDAQFRATFNNAFNHPNFSSIDAEIEDAGDYGSGDGFGDPSVTSGGGRTITFGAYIHF